MEAREALPALLALIEHVIQESQRPAGTKLFRSLGPRRQRMAQRQLRMARDSVREIAVRWGLPIEHLHAHHGTAPCDDLEDDNLALARAFRRAAQCAQQRGDTVAMHWLLTRARVHEEHSRFLRG